jgi:hypothetical protein
VFAEAPEGLEIRLDIDEVRPVGEAAATESGVATLTSGGRTVRVSRFLAVFSREGDGWKMSEVREFAAPDLDAPLSGHLEDLDWFLGDWIDEGPSGVIRFHGAWEDEATRRYLIRTFTLEVGGRVLLKGTHRLGYDAAEGVVRGWMFDDRGGFAEERWYRAGPDAWTVESRGVDADGRRATSTRTVARESDGTTRIVVQSRTLDGESLDAQEVHRQSRPPATEEVKP